ncbi:MAG TPA: PIG-L deacetylase family protein [Gemmatimonadaceae bacterium]|nr:PIG-L deacetylase family protein [Gemmatimonadaceae bacterium]
MAVDERCALVLVAHADDETLGCGGTIAKLVRHGGWRIRVAILGDGIVRARGGEQDNRGGAAAACAVLGVPAPDFLGFPDQKFDTVPVADLANAVSALGVQPDLILTHAETDLNRDHRLTLEVAKIVGRPRSRPVSILGCEIPSTTFWNGGPFPANYFVDISAELETKIEAFTRYTNELQPYPHPWSREGLRLLAQYHGMQCGLPFAEAFTVVRAYEGRLPGIA